MSYIESVLQRLLIPDSSIIKQATKQLLEYFVSEKCIQGLFEVLNTSTNSQNRIYAATLLRKKVKNWKTIKDFEKNELKNGVLNILTREPEETVRKQIMWLIASIYKYSLKSGQEWPDLLKFINELILSAQPEQHISGVYMLSILNEEAAEQIKPHYNTLFKMFSTILSETNNPKSAFYVLKCMMSMIPYTDENELKELTSLLPYAVNASIKIIKNDQQEETITAIFDFFQSLIEYEIPTILPYIKNLTDMVLEFISDGNYKNPTRICAMNFLNVLIETQKASLLKNDMIRPIVNAVFGIMCLSDHPLQTKNNVEVDILEDEEENEEIVDDTENLFTSSTQVLDYCALYFPAKKFIKILVDYVSPAVSHENPLHRRAALAALAITAEGCADYYKNHYLELLVDICLKGMHDPHPQVVQLSYFALCQFSEYFHPSLVQHADRIMQLLYETIETKNELQNVSRFTVRFYDALQSFCENLEEELFPYLPTLMAKLIKLETQSNFSYKLQRLIVSTFSSIVSSVKNDFNPYFDFVVQIIKPHLLYSDIQKLPDAKFLQIECIDLMGVFAKYIGKDKFTDSLIEDCLKFVQNVLINDNDPEIRSAAFDLLSGLTSKLKENLILIKLMPQLLETLKSEEGINIIDKEDKQNDIFSAFDEIDLDNEESDSNLEDESDDKDGEDVNKIIVDNEYVSEKLSAICCLETITQYMNLSLIDFYNDCYTELKSLSLFVHLNIRKEAYLGLANLISYLHDYCNVNLNNMDETARNKMIQTFTSNLNDFYECSVNTIKMDANRQLVMTVFDAVKTLLFRCAPFIKSNFSQFSKPLEEYSSLVIETFQNKIYCQLENNNDECEDGEDNQAEYDHMLKEFAGDVIPSLALCLPDQIFHGYFEKACTFLIRLLNKSESTFAEKSFAIGVIGETISNLDNVPTLKAQQLFAEFYKHINSTEDEIKSNTIFSIGVLCSQSKDSLKQYYSKIVNDLFEILKIEKCKQTLDNICGTLCRLFMACVNANLEGLNYELMLKTIFELTPLKVDHCEYHTLFSFILHISSNKMLFSYYPKIIELCGNILLNNQYESKPGTKDLIVNFLRFINNNYKQELDLLLYQMKPELGISIKSCLNI